MKNKYLQDELDKKLFHAMEECGEFIQAASKMLRWGAFSYNPELPQSERISNMDWVMEEARNVLESVERFKTAIDESSNTQLDMEFPLYND